jgi:hypothetical protein
MLEAAEHTTVAHHLELASPKGWEQQRLGPFATSEQMRKNFGADTGSSIFGGGDGSATISSRSRKSDSDVTRGGGREGGRETTKKANKK